MVFKNFLCRKGQEMKVRNDSNRNKLQPKKLKLISNKLEKIF